MAVGHMPLNISDVEGPGSYVRCVYVSQGDSDTVCCLDVLGVKLEQRYWNRSRS
jgi:hypothetical protein